MSVTIDSRVYRASFYGILNANGAFWTPLAFDSEEAAKQHLLRFWNKSDAEWQGLRRSFKIVPVRIQLETIAPASAAAARKSRARSGLGAEPGRAARSEAEGDAQTSTPSGAQP